MLHIIKGLSGCGKTQYMWDHIINNFSEDKKVIILVPEQFSFEAEKMFCNIYNHGNKLTNIEVLNFTRLANIILREYGGLARQTLNEVKSNIIINVILSELKDHLKVYKKQINNNRFNKDILSLLNLLKANRVSYQDVMEYSQNIEKNLLAAKLHDISLIYKSFQKKIEKDYMGNNDILNLACDKLICRQFFKNYTVYIDSFNTFTNSEYILLESIISQSQDVYISLCLNNNCHEGDIVDFIIKTECEIINIARKNKIKIDKPILLNKPYRFKNKQLEILSDSIYKILNSQKIDNTINWSKQDNFNIIECLTINQELEYVGSKILDLIKQNGYKYKDIAIITRDLNLYRSQLDNIFDIYEIPYFMDERRSIKDEKLIIFLTSSLEAVNRNYKTLSILKLLKTGFFDIDEDDISKLEIYCQIWGIDGDLWLKEFKNNPRGFSEKFENEDKILLRELNELREKIINILVKLKNDLKKDKKVDDFIKIIYNYIIDMEIKQKLKNMISKDIENLEFIEENIKVWDSLINIFDDLSDVIGQKIISLNDFLDFFNIAIANFDMGILPQTLDQVIIGQADHLIGANFKAVFVIGLQQGSFPLSHIISPFFSEAENVTLESFNLNLYNNKIKFALLERFYLYKAITSSSNKVYLSYHTHSIDGTYLTKSFFLNQLDTIFDSLVLKKFDPDDLNVIQNDASAYNYFCNNFNHNNNLILNSVEQYLKNIETYSEKINKIKNSYRNNLFYISNTNFLKNFIGSNFNLSPSSIERFHICKFKFFCNDILKIKNIKKVELTNLEQGIIIHYVLKELLEDGFIMDEMKLKSKLKDIINKYINKTTSSRMFLTNKNQFIYDELISDISKLIDYIASEQSISNFKTTNFELEISENSTIKPLYIKTNNNTLISLCGKVDRLDRCMLNDVEYIRIIDYKSGMKKFSLDDVFYGLNMQMLLYLFIIIDFYKNNNKKVAPAGVLYLSVKEKIPFCDRNMKQISKKNLFPNFKMNGILLDNIEILNLMETDLKGIFLPVKQNKNGSLSKLSSVINESLFDILEKFLKITIISMIETIFNGEIYAMPVEGNRYQNVCSFCDFKTICNLGEDKFLKLLSKPPENWLNPELLNNRNNNS